ncbi:MAG: hypothetical protein ACREQW_12860 [Candidatus Binatia bacterium]
MRAESLGGLVLRVEVLQGVLALGLFGLLAPLGVLELRPLLLGVVFAGINFFLLAFGVRLVLAPLGGKRRLRTGVALLVVKLGLFLGVLSLLLFKFNLEPLSFAAGVTCLLVAIVCERLWASLGD